MLKFVSPTGSPLDLRILDRDDKDVGAVLAIEKVAIDFPGPGEMGRATVTLNLICCEIGSERVDFVTRNPATSKIEPVQSITFRSGAVLEFKEDGEFVVRPAA